MASTPVTNDATTSKSGADGIVPTRPHHHMSATSTSATKAPSVTPHATLVYWMTNTASSLKSPTSRKLVCRYLLHKNGHLPTTRPQVWAWLYLYRAECLRQSEHSENIEASSDVTGIESPVVTERRWAARMALHIYNNIGPLFQRIKTTLLNGSQTSSTIGVEPQPQDQPETGSSDAPNNTSQRPTTHVTSAARAGVQLAELVAACDPLLVLPRQQAAIVCPRCKSGQHLTIERKQIRRPDEPQTVIYRCSNHAVVYSWR